MGINCSFILCSCLFRGGKATEVRGGWATRREAQAGGKESEAFHVGVQLPHTARRFVANGPGAGASTAREKNRFGFFHRDAYFIILLRGSLVMVFVIALTGLNEPLCVSSRFVIIYRSHVAFSLHLLKGSFSSRSESMICSKPIIPTLGYEENSGSHTGPYNARLPFTWTFELVRLTNVKRAIR